MSLIARSVLPVDVVGIGLNATDTIIRLPQFPSLDSKVEILSTDVKAGGQVASAMVACRRWGLRARYVGKIGDDSAGEFQRHEMKREGVQSHWIVARGCSSQSSFILLDQASGERTVLWKRDPAIALRAKDLKKNFLSGAKVLLVDGHDTEAATQAAHWAREQRILVVGDFDNRYPGVESLLEKTDFVLSSKDFPERVTSESDILKSLPKISKEFKSRLIGATLGRLGVLCWDGDRFYLCPGFKVRAIDTTGAGDIFHAAFVYALTCAWSLQRMLEFSCAAAALNCEAAGARGGIVSLEKIDRLLRTGERSEPAYSDEELLEAGKVQRKSYAHQTSNPRGSL
jgi:sulfofructose kinase